MSLLVRAVIILCGIVAVLAPRSSQLFAAGASLDVLHAFPTGDNSGYAPGGLIEGSDGNFYGVTRRGGGAACGTVYKLTPAGAMTQLHLFGTDAFEGCEPVGRLLEGLDGKLYGVTSTGSATIGAIFRLDSDGSDFEILLSFTSPGTQGAQPNGSLVQGADGTLYGTTAGGGTNGVGTVFKLAPNGTAFTVLHMFPVVPAGQVNSQAGLLLASDGNLYGTLTSGGPNSDGGVFRIGTNGTGYTLIHQYVGNPNGVQSDAPLIEGNDGLLYGSGVRYTLQGSCGPGCTSYLATFVAFSMAKDGSGKTELHTFPTTLVGGLLLASDGNLYGFTGTRNAVVAGEVWRVAPNGTSYTVLHTFGTANDGFGPIDSLIEGTDGKLYGATQRGGNANGAGVLFSLTTTGVEAVVHSFGSDFDGFIPVAGVTIGNDGLLYGATSAGGAPFFQTDPTGSRGSEGAVFKLGTDGSGFGLLHSFTFANDDGSTPLGTPIQGLDGALYGTTTNGGAISSAGAVYRVPTDGNPETLVHSFQFCSPCNEGFHPSMGVIQAADGTLYGASDLGGTGSSGNGRGLIYKVQPNGTGYSALRSFLGGAADGSFPKGPIMLADDGRLYGTASRGGNTGCLGGGCGTIFGIDTDGTDYATLRAFQGGADGAVPAAGLLEASDGYLYGTTSEGGGSGCGGTGCGTVFRIAADGSDYAVLHAFAGGVDGATPVAGLAEATDGTLYGTTRYGGGSGCGGDGCGTVFRLNGAGAYGLAYEFAGADGSDPRAPLTLGPSDTFYGTTSRGGSPLDGGTVFKLQDTAMFLPAPTGLAATDGDGNGELDLSWTASAGATGYDVYQGTAAGAQSAVPVATGVVGTSVTVTGLTTGTQYFFVVRAAAGADRSESSNEASAQPLAAPGLTFTAAPAGITVGGSAQLTWDSSQATSCTASGDWTGAQAVDGTQAVTPAAIGTFNYVLSCTGAGGTTQVTAVVTVSAAASGGGGGGGALNALAVLLLSLAALIRRRSGFRR